MNIQPRGWPLFFNNLLKTSHNRRNFRQILKILIFQRDSPLKRQSWMKLPRNKNNIFQYRPRSLPLQITEIFPIILKVEKKLFVVSCFNFHSQQIFDTIFQIFLTHFSFHRKPIMHHELACGDFREFCYDNFKLFARFCLILEIFDNLIALERTF